jgi:glycine C-acetyltransferase
LGSTRAFVVHGADGLDEITTTGETHITALNAGTIASYTITPEHFGLLGEVDVVTGTLGKALGGAAGGYVAASDEVCALLAQRSRPQLFSNALPPTVACSARKAIELLRSDPTLLERQRASTARFRSALVEAGWAPLPGEAAIVPIIVGETAEAIRLSERLLDEGVFVTGFGYPVVPEGTARIRVQISAALEPHHLDRALEAFARVRGA